MRFNWKLWIFLGLEIFLYYMILFEGGIWSQAGCFASVVLCCLYALVYKKQSNHLLMAGLCCTVAADFCLILCNPVQRLWGMVFFLGAQIMYAFWLQINSGHNLFILVRAVVSAVTILITMLVLKSNTDMLAIVSLCYYANLIMNIFVAFFQFRKDSVFPVALVLFILCDTVIGLQVASGNYISIGENSTLYRLIFMDFNLAWFFYLPSQVLIALRCAGIQKFCKRSTE